MRGLTSEIVHHILMNGTDHIIPERQHLALQQSSQIRDHLDLRVGAICGEMGVDWWDAGRWKRVLDEHDVLVSTPQVCCSIMCCKGYC
jgi:hypothetical protein